MLQNTKNYAFLYNIKLKIEESIPLSQKKVR